MIKPTVGRIVLVFSRAMCHDKSQPEPAIVTYVHSNNCINVAGFDHNGNGFGLASLYLVQENTLPLPEGALRAEWMPYQKAEAERLEKRLSAGEAI